jgi:choloylglycine hydrolase
MKLLLQIVLIFMFLCDTAFPCTGFFLNTGESRIIGRTMDWPTGEGYVSVSERGSPYRSVFLTDGSSPAEWTAKYGGVIFYQIMDITGVGTLTGPFCGMNEKGLWAGSFWLHKPPALKYQEKDGRISVSSWELVRYLLDNFSSVEDVIRHIDEVRVAGCKKGSRVVPLHWLIADASGDSAVIEFPEKSLSIHRPAVPAVITNNFYEYSRMNLSEYRGYGGVRSAPVDEQNLTSLNRFLIASHFVKANEDSRDLSVEKAIGIVKHVTQTNVRHSSTSNSLTQWATIYDLKKKKVYWYTRMDPNLRNISLDEIDFSNTGRTRMMNIHEKVSGKVSDLLK